MNTTINNKRFAKLFRTSQNNDLVNIGKESRRSNDRLPIIVPNLPFPEIEDQFSILQEMAEHELANLRLITQENLLVYRYKRFLVLATEKLEIQKHFEEKNLKIIKNFEEFSYSYHVLLLRYSLSNLATMRLFMNDFGLDSSDYFKLLHSFGFESQFARTLEKSDSSETLVPVARKSSPVAQLQKRIKELLIGIEPNPGPSPIIRRYLAADFDTDTFYRTIVSQIYNMIIDLNPTETAIFLERVGYSPQMLNLDSQELIDLINDLVGLHNHITDEGYEYTFEDGLADFQQYADETEALTNHMVECVRYSIREFIYDFGFDSLQNYPLLLQYVMDTVKHQIEAPPAPPLVGVEPNPGPFRRDFHHCFPKTSLQAFFWMFFFDFPPWGILYLAFCVDLLAYFTFAFNHAFFEPNIQRLKSFEVPPAPALVGIEPNPGPFNEVQVKAICRSMENPRSKHGRKAKNVSPPVQSKRKNNFTCERDKKFNLRKIEPQMFDIGLDAKTIEALANLTDSIGAIPTSLPKGLDLNVHMPVAETVLSKFTEFTTDPRVRMIGLCLILAFLRDRFVSTESTTWKAIYSLMSLYAIYKCDNAVVEFISKLNLFGGIESQGAGDLPPLVLFVLGYIYYGSFAKHLDQGTVAGFLKSLSDGPKIKDGTVFAYDLIVHYIVKFVNFLCEKLGREKWADNNPFPQIDTFAKEVASMVQEFRDGAQYNYENGVRVYRLHQRGQEILNGLPRAREASEYRTYVLQVLSLLKPLIAKLERSNITGNGPRSEPLAFLLAGASGVGKSTIIPILVLELLAKVLPEEKLQAFLQNHNDFILNRVSENVFHDNDHGQPIWFMDEIGQTVDVAGNEQNPYMEAIRAINCANWPLHAAHLDDKGNLNFQHSIVMGTTNRRHFSDLKSIILPEAFIRRWKNPYLMVPKKQYCTDATRDSTELWDRRLDEAKVGSDFFNTDVPEFYLWNFQTGKLINTEPIGYDQLIEHLVNQYKRSQSKGDTMLNYHKSLKEKFVQERISKLRKQDGDEDDVYHDASDSFEDVSETYYQTFLNKLSKVPDLVSTHKYLLAFTGIISVVSTIVYFLNSVIEPQDLSGHTHSMRNKQRVTTRTPKKGARKFLRNAKNPIFRVEDQASVTLSTNGAQSISNKVFRRSTYQMLRNGVRIGTVFFVKGRTLCMPLHFYERMKQSWSVGEGDIYTLQKVSAIDFTFTIRPEDVIEEYICDDMETDICFLRLTKKIHAHADLSSLFVSEEDPRYSKTFSGALSIYRANQHMLIPTRVDPKSDISYSGFSAPNAYTYPVQTLNGDCGSILLSSDSRFPSSSILGLHVAGDGSSGYSIAISKELVDDAILYETVGDDLDNFEGEPIEAQIEGHFCPLEKIQGPRVPTKNQVTPSVLHESWSESEYAPSLLVRNGELDPWVVSRANYSRKQPDFNIKVLEHCTNLVVANIFNRSVHNDPWAPRLYTFEEAIKGIDGVPFCEGIPRQTSLGFPECMRTNQQGKKEFFGATGDYDFSTPKSILLKQRCADHIQRATNGVRSRHIFADYLKDERRKKTKVSTGATRAINAAPIDLLVLSRMYFGDLVRWLMTNKIENGMLMGVNPYSQEWDHLARNMKNIGVKTLAGDYKCYDGSLPIVLMYQFQTLYKRFYAGCPEADNRVRDVLFEEIVNSRHVANGLIFEWFGSNPSGNYLTTALNSFCNIVNLYYQICVSILETRGIDSTLATVADLRTISPFLEHEIYIAVFGDDNLIAFSSRLAEALDLQTFTDMMHVHGFIFTSDDKSDAKLAYKPITEVSILKRKFVFDKIAGRYIAPLDLSVVLEMPYWTKSNTKASDAVETTVDQSLLELALHGKSVYNTWAPKIVDASLQKLHYCVAKPDFESQFEIALHNTQFY